MLKRFLLRWLGVESIISAAIVAERQALASTLDTMATAAEQTTGNIAGDLRAIVKQLNANTVVLLRWAKESATLNAIERKHAAKSARTAHANGNGRVLSLPTDHAPDQDVAG